MGNSNFKDMNICKNLLPAYRFHAGSWQRVGSDQKMDVALSEYTSLIETSDDSHDGSTVPSIFTTSVSSISIATWNVWFSKFQLKKRAMEMFRILEETSPDVICLQEVTPEFLDLLIQESWIQQHYFISDATGETVFPYGVVMLTKFPVVYFHSINFPDSTMFRNILIAEILIGTGSSSASLSPISTSSGSSSSSSISSQGEPETFFISSTHLESLQKNMRYRLKQLQMSFDILSHAHHAIMAGDFNFCSKWDENSHIPAEFVDSWSFLHGDDVEVGHTMPATDCLAPWRPDRVLIKSHSIYPVMMKRLGTERIDYDLKEKEKKRKSFVATPSDHYGLYTELRIL